MTVYKLYYFDLRGLAETIRQLFVLAGQTFEDKRFTFEEWPQHKNEMPLGQMPLLEVDGVQIAQSMAIARFLGKRFGFVGKDDIENAKLDMYADVVRDAMSTDPMKQWPKIKFGMMPGDEAAFFKEHVMAAVEPFASHIEKQLLANNNGLILGEKVTWVDVYAAEFFSKLIDFGDKTVLDAFPRIKQLIDRIHNIASIQAHLKARGPTKF